MDMDGAVFVDGGFVGVGVDGWAAMLVLSGVSALSHDDSGSRRRNSRGRPSCVARFGDATDETGRGADVKADRSATRVLRCEEGKTQNIPSHSCRPC